MGARCLADGQAEPIRQTQDNTGHAVQHGAAVCRGTFLQMFYRIGCQLPTLQEYLSGKKTVVLLPAHLFKDLAHVKSSCYPLCFALLCFTPSSFSFSIFQKGICRRRVEMTLAHYLLQHQNKGWNFTGQHLLQSQL